MYINNHIITLNLDNITTNKVNFDDTAKILEEYKKYMDGYTKLEYLVFRLDNKKTMHPDYVTRRFRRKAWLQNGYEKEKSPTD